MKVHGRALCESFLCEFLHVSWRESVSPRICSQSHRQSLSPGQTPVIPGMPGSPFHPDLFPQINGASHDLWLAVFLTHTHRHTEAYRHTHSEGKQIYLSSNYVVELLHYYSMYIYINADQNM